MIGRLVHVLVDVLLPGDEDAALPAASEVGVNDALQSALETADGLAYHRVVSRIARELGGAHEFIRATPDQRIAVLQAVEKEMPGELRRLVVFALEAYYQSDPVIVAMGWRTEPPQPLGHEVDPLEESLLEPVRKRGPLWREREPSP
jgi:gluconate 2-dehydrogenase subunit 3-like protein